MGYPFEPLCLPDQVLADRRREPGLQLDQALSVREPVPRRTQGLRCLIGISCIEQGSHVAGGQVFGIISPLETDRQSLRCLPVAGEFLK